MGSLSHVQKQLRLPDHGAISTASQRLGSKTTIETFQYCAAHGFTFIRGLLGRLLYPSENPAEKNEEQAE
jgi:hypothetical protein